MTLTRQQFLRVTLVVCSLLIACTVHGQSPTARLTLSGNVKVNGNDVNSGLSIASGDTVETTKSSAVVSLGKLGRVELLQNSKAQISFDEQFIKVGLEAGGVRITKEPEAKVDVAWKEVKVGSGDPALTTFVVDTSCGDVYIAVKKGLVSAYQPGVMAFVNPGKPSVFGKAAVGCKRPNP